MLNPLPMLDPLHVSIYLLVMLGVAAAVSSALIRSVKFKSLLFRDFRTLQQKIDLMLWVCAPMVAGVWIRTVTNFVAADLSFETTLVLAVVAGRIAGCTGGALLAVPALLHGEWATLPYNLLAGLVAGQLRALSTDKEEIWYFSPFVDLSIYRWIRRNFPKPRLFDWQIVFFLTIVGLRALRSEVAHFAPHSIFNLRGGPLWLKVLIYTTSIVVIGTWLKIWNGVRIQIKLEEQERLLLQARMEALQNQINPHFLFNTLNSVSSLVRVDPDTARDLIIKLANILRRLLRSTESFVPLREELAFIDDYLDIEVVRFGREKLKVFHNLDPASLDLMVPSMLLQPLVENCIKHGLSPKVEGGTIRIRSRLTETQITLEVEDDGVGMIASQQSQKPADLAGAGIGMANIAERLKVLYNDAARIKINSHPEMGTIIQIVLPRLHPDSANQLQEAFSSTRR
jgi:two-component system LytT family sensor kinase